MDNYVDNRGKRNNTKRELCLFHSTVTSFEKLLFTKHNIRRLIIIGQRDISSFHAVTELILLQELWIVECGIKDVPSFRENCLLKKLYLYSNEICHIPDLDVCSYLIVLNLAGNKVCKLEYILTQNLETLTCLQELNLANNNLQRINKISWRKCDLHYLNMAGNPLYYIRDIRYLSQLQKLNSLVFADPLYGDCPLVALCNYRMHVIHYLPHIKNLDHYKIGDKEKHWINHFFKKQVTYYNVLLHKHLNTHLKLLNRKYKYYENRMLHFRNQLYLVQLNKNGHCCSETDSCETSQCIKMQMKLKRKQLREWKEIIFTRFKIVQQQLLINMSYCGNINFIEYNTSSESTVIQLCKQFLQASLCSAMKTGLSVKDLKLHKVTKVTNKEMDQVNIRKKESPEPDETSMILKILASPGVTDIQKWPFNVLQTELLIEEELRVTNCLAAADSEWLNKMLLGKKDDDELDICNMCEKLRVCVLIQTPIVNSNEKLSNVNDCLHIKYACCYNNTNEICQIFTLINTDIKNPIFIIEYEYILAELKNEDGWKDIVAAYSADDIVPICLSDYNITQYISIDETLNILSLVKICISGQNINSLNINADLPNLKECDISFNRLKEFPNSSFMKNVQILNINSNSIQVLNIRETLPALEQLDISWNLLINCSQVLNSFTVSMPNMSNLKISNNPFKDVSDPQLVEYVMHIHIPKLKFINDRELENINFPQNYFPCAFNMCKLNHRQRNKLIYLKQSTLKNIEQMKLLENINMEQAKYIHISQDFITASNSLKKMKNVQELCITCCSLFVFPCTKPLKYLMKLNLGNNFISVLNSFTQENFPVLKYLDLTNNLITNLDLMGSFHSLQELYCGNNQIETITQIDNVKTWRALRVIDLCNNPITADTLHKKFITFHLSNIEYISGEYVRNSDISEASYIFGNKCDKHVLNTIYETDKLTNITQLSLVDCSLSKVDISAELLPQLESLDLSKNRITYLWGLHSFKSLRTLCLSYNRLETFNGVDYEKNKCTFPKLYTLFLDHNCIKSIMNITKQKLPVIKHLFLNNNCLQNINEINHCPTLESLVLDSNVIEVLHIEDFIENENLKLLSIENNKIKSLEFVKPLKKLKKLYLAHNRLENEFEIEYILLLKTLEEITLEGNPLYNKDNKDKIIAFDFGVKDAEIERV